MMKKILTIWTSVVGMLVLTAVPVFAHAVVKPGTAGVGAFTDFTLGVPSEKPIATTEVKLFLPAGLHYISPIVKPGWTINEVKSGSEDSAPITEIDWTGGQIPAEQKDLFLFSAQVPSKAAELDWKVEQTYADGSVVSWSLSSKDQQPKDDKGNPDFSKFGPYSKTMVVNDLTGTNQTTATTMVAGSNASEMTLADLSQKVKWNIYVSGAAIVLSLVAIGMQLMKRK